MKTFVLSSMVAIFLLASGIPVWAGTVQAQMDQEFAGIKAHLAKRQAYLKVYPEAIKQHEATFDISVSKANKQILEMVPNLQISLIPKFIKSIRVLVKFYGYNPLAILETVKEKLIFLHLSNKEGGIEKYLRQLEALTTEADDNPWPSFKTPQSHKDAGKAYFAYDYNKAIELFPIAIEKIQNVPIPDVDTEDPYYDTYVEYYELQRANYYMMDHGFMYECQEYLENWQSSYEWIQKYLVALKAYYTAAH
jgi:tetratricopeptide (TPR) repeat protein